MARIPGPRFLLWLGLTLLFRAWFAAVLPMTGDEAYFVWWGWQPDWGFYDHPPMIGWWLAVLSRFSNSEFWLRLPSTLQPALLGLALWWALPRLWPALGEAGQQHRREGTALLVLLAPANVWNVLVTTDTPLVYFSVLSALAWLRAAQERTEDTMGASLKWYAISGFFLAGAVLSKYFVALLGFAYLVDALRRRQADKNSRALAGLAVAYACCVPALALMAWWNSGNCWPNYMFNFVNRNEGATPSFVTPLLYIASLLYLLTPVAAWFALRPGENDRRTTNADLRTLIVLFAVPLVLFALLSVPKTIGLHWLLTFVPLVLIWLGLRLSDARLQTLVRVFIGFALVHIIAIVVISRLPLETWKHARFYDGAVLTVDHDGFARAIAADRADRDKNWVLAMDGYSNAVTLGYNLREHVIVFGTGSYHARHDDIQTDFRTLAGRNILILQKTSPQLADYLPYFAHVSVDSFDLRGVRYWRVRGEGFNFPAYRDGILSLVRSKYYQLPHWLPQRTCYFCDRYFPGQVCQK